MERVLRLLLCGLLGSSIAVADPVHTELQTQLMGLYNSYDKAAAAGDLKKAFTFLSAARRKELEAYTKKTSQKQEFIAMSKWVMFDSFEPQHSQLSADGKTVEIVGVATKKLTPAMLKKVEAPPDGMAMNELTLEFAKEGEHWKYVNRTFGPDPRTTKKCDRTFEPEQAFNSDKTTELGGLVRDVSFEKEYTFFIVRIVDEEQCLFLPTREVLEKAGFNAELLQPYALAEITAYPHPQNNQKFWVVGLQVKK